MFLVGFPAMRAVFAICFAVFACILFVNRTESTKASQGSGTSERIFVRVINGQNARPHEFPWQVSMRNRRTNEHICGGSLINPYLVLTSAHCVLMNPCFTKYDVVLGAHTRKGRTFFQQNRRVSKWFVHSYYSVDHFQKDVALLWLNRPVRMTRFVYPIQLPRPGSKVAVGTNCIMSGWGRTRSSGQYANTLQKALLPIVHHQYCARINDKLFKVDYHSMVCAGRRGWAGGCQGDSGGPLVCYERRRWILRGVVSWGHEGCNTHHYTVFARVSSFIYWIKYTAARRG